MMQLPFSLEKLYAHAVRSLNERDANAWSEVHGVDRERNSLLLEFVTKTIEISMHMEAKVIRAPFQTLFPARLLTRSLATDNNGGTFKSNENLRGTANFMAVDDFAAQFFRIPGCSGLRVLTDEVDVVKYDAGIIHNDFFPPAKCYWTLRHSVAVVSSIISQRLTVDCLFKILANSLSL